MSARRRVVSAGIATAVLVGAWVATETAPSEHDWLDPLPVDALVGESAVGRNLAATVHGAEAAATVVDAQGGWIETGGVWVVVDVSARAVVDEGSALLNGARLVVDEVEYTPTDRVEGQLSKRSLSIGIDLRAPLVFELPEVPAEAELRLAERAHGSGDSVLVVPLAFDAGDLTSSIDLPSPTLEAR